MAVLAAGCGTRVGRGGLRPTEPNALDPDGRGPEAAPGLGEPMPAGGAKARPALPGPPRLLLSGGRAGQGSRRAILVRSTVARLRSASEAGCARSERAGAGAAPPAGPGRRSSLARPWPGQWRAPRSASRQGRAGGGPSPLPRPSPRTRRGGSGRGSSLPSGAPFAPARARAGKGPTCPPRRSPARAPRARNSRRTAQAEAARGIGTSDEPPGGLEPPAPAEPRGFPPTWSETGRRTSPRSRVGDPEAGWGSQPGAASRAPPPFRSGPLRAGGSPAELPVQLPSRRAETAEEDRPGRPGGSRTVSAPLGAPGSLARGTAREGPAPTPVPAARPLRAREGSGRSEEAFPRSSLPAAPRLPACLPSPRLGVSLGRRGESSGRERRRSTLRG